MTARTFLVGLALIGLLAACGSSEPAMPEYGERLNEIVDTYSADAEAAWVEFIAVSDPALEDLRKLFDRDVVTRRAVEEAFLDLDPPGEIADVHDLLVEWLVALTGAEEDLVGRIAAVGSLDEFLGSSEYRVFEETLIEGADVCRELQSELDATAARGVFADTPWMPSDLKEVVDAVIGCESIPDDLDPTFRR